MARSEAGCEGAVSGLRGAAYQWQAKLAAAGMGGQQPTQPAQQPAQPQQGENLSDDDLLKLYGGE